MLVEGRGERHLPLILGIVKAHGPISTGDLYRIYKRKLAESGLHPLGHADPPLTARRIGTILSNAAKADAIHGERVNVYRGRTTVWRAVE